MMMGVWIVWSMIVESITSSVLYHLYLPEGLHRTNKGAQTNYTTYMLICNM
jgi:hypothetical protein